MLDISDLATQLKGVSYEPLDVLQQVEVESVCLFQYLNRYSWSPLGVVADFIELLDPHVASHTLLNALAEEIIRITASRDINVLLPLQKNRPFVAVVWPSRLISKPVSRYCSHPLSFPSSHRDLVPYRTSLKQVQIHLNPHTHSIAQELGLELALSPKKLLELKQQLIGQLPLKR